MRLSHAFTLIELLIVIAIIGGLASIGLVTYPGAQKSARDTSRKSDLNQFKISLEVFANKSNGLYPSRTSSVQICSVLFGDLGLSGTCKDDPLSANHYSYISNGTGSGNLTATKYVIWASLERTSSTGDSQYWVVCSDGGVGRINQSDWTPSSTCPNNLVP